MPIHGKQHPDCQRKPIHGKHHLARRRMCPTTFLSFRDLSSFASDSRFAAFLFAAVSLFSLCASNSSLIEVKSSRSFWNSACIAAIRAFSSSTFKTSFTHTHTGVYATRAVGRKTQPTRTGFMPPVFREWPHSARARWGATTDTRAAGFETHLREITHKKTHGTCLLYQRLASPHDIVSGCWGVP